ncbi:MAG: hypothetical protein M9938_06915 [Solirubrobacterales bacterium]|nr:hypothetical protein [Solirubrobacterales bacterium]
MATSGRRPINAPSGSPRTGGTPWVGLGILLVLTLILAALVAHFIFGVGPAGDDGPEGLGKVKPGELTEKAREARTGGRSGGTLGYPAAATRNTTRVPGGDPVDISIASAYATYPVSGPGAPPAAVTIADDRDWQAGTVAATFAARPVGAPILLAPSGKLSEDGEKALAQLNPAGAPETGESQIFTVGQASSPGGYRTKRVTGDDPADLAVEAAKLKAKLSGGPPGAFVILSDEEPGFAGPVAAWLARSGDVALFTGKDEVPGATLDHLKEKANKKVPVFVIGSTDAVSAKAYKQLGEATKAVERVDGKDPVSVAVELVKFYSGSFGWNLNDPGHGYSLARSDRPMDAIAATALSTGGTWPAMLLTDSASELPASVHEYLLDVKPGYDTDPTRALYNHVWIIGDTSLINVDQQAKVDDAAELTPVETTGSSQ